MLRRTARLRVIAARRGGRQRQEHAEQAAEQATRKFADEPLGGHGGRLAGRAAAGTGPDRGRRHLPACFLSFGSLAAAAGSSNEIFSTFW